MSNKNPTWEERSRGHWYSEDDSRPIIEQVKAGSLQRSAAAAERSAAATEKMANGFNVLLKEHEELKIRIRIEVKANENMSQEYKKALRRISGLKGTITRMKNKANFKNGGPIDGK